MVVRQADTRFITRKGSLCRIKFWSLGQRLLQGDGRVGREQLTLWIRFFGQLEIKRLEVWILVCPDDKTHLVFRLFESVFTLNDLHAARGHLRFGSIDVQWRQCS